MTKLRKASAGCVLLLFAALPIRADDGKSTVSIGDQLQLFLDDWLIDSMTGLQLKLHTPRRAEVVLRKDKPWEDSTMFDPVVIKDGSRYRMWYRTNFNSPPFYTGYAESNNGVQWTKPSLGLVEFGGEKTNNLVWSSGPDKSSPYVLCVFKDNNSKTQASERYKAIGVRRRRGSDPPTDDLFGLVSADGLRWRLSQKEPIIRGPRGDSMFDSHNVAFWDAARRQYVIYARGWPDGWPGGTRGIRRAVSSDFRRWSSLETLELWADSDRDHLYKNAATPYYRRPDILLMFPKRFLEKRKSPDPNWKHRGLSDIVFMSSRDGVHWDRRFREAFLRPGRDRLNWHERAIEVGPGLVPTGDGEMSLYFMEHYRTDSVRIRRGVLREDGLVSVHAKYKGGELVTRPLVFAGDQLVINYSTSAAGSIRVEIQDPAGKPLVRYELERCDEIYGDELNRVVQWDGKSDLQKLAGEPIRLRIALRDADLFSFRFRRADGHSR
ncbi:MAG: hypothetical protein CMJ48_11770 [Planctomycetaceae bacterium]|nr:hypothetical protein [Planctomycetaceae bacterium]